MRMRVRVLVVIALIGLSVLLICGERPNVLRTPDHTAGRGVTVEVQTQTRKVTGIQERHVDPAPFRTGWRSAEVDENVLAEALSRPMYPTDVALRDLQRNQELVPWLDGLVSEDEFGRAVAECRKRHERQQTEPCVWEQDIVLRRDSEGQASVVAVLPRVEPEHNPDSPKTPFATECKAWASCMAAAWKNRPGFFPEGANDSLTRSEDGSGFVAIRTTVYHLGAHGVSQLEYENAYADRLARLEERVRLREQAYVEAEDAGLRSLRSREGLYYNLLLERGQIADARAYLQYLRVTED